MSGRMEAKKCEEGHVLIQEIRLLSATMLKIGIQKCFS